MKITINEPCHENWDAMTPNKQGAFCKSCVKDVVDFSKMGIEEIKSFFSKPQSDKVCGRFEEKQLQELSFDDFFAKFTYWNFTKKFAVIFFMAFGFWIFSNSVAIAQSDRHMKGEVMFVPDKTPVKKDTVKTQITPPVNDKKHIKGKIASVPEPVCKPEMLMGSIAYIPQDIKKPEPIIKGNATVTPKEEKNLQDCVLETIPKEGTAKKTSTIVVENHYILGQMVVQNPITKTEATKPQPEIKVDSVVTGVERIADNNTQLNIYPNPSNGNFVIETNIGTKQTVSIYDESGKVVLTQNIIGSTTIYAGSLNEGIYIIRITNNEGIVNKRVVIVK